MGALEGGALEDEYPPDRLFESKPLLARIVVISAGVVMNAVFAWMVYVGISLGYGKVEDPTTRIARVDEELLPDEAQALASLQFGTQIVRINGDTMSSRNDIDEAIIDVTSDQLRFEFAGSRAPVTVPIPGTAARKRMDLDGALIPLHQPRIGLVAPGRPAAQAGIEPGDVVIRINGDTIRTWDEMVNVIEPAAGDTLVVTLARADSVLDVVLVPTEQTLRDPVSGESRQVGQIGIGSQGFDPIRVEFGLVEAMAEGVRLTLEDVGRVLFTLKGMIVGQISPRELGGPIFIGQMSGQVAAAGMLPLLAFMAFLSVNLAILNLLPIPVLDGGHLIFLFIEGIRGKPLSLTVRLRLTQVGLFVLLGIMALALTNDLFRVIGK